jgi:F0F1-type ATP synthase membrane subunit a
MKSTLAATTSALAIVAATIFCYLTIGNAISWACNRLLQTAMPFDRPGNPAMALSLDAAINLLVGLACAYVAVQFVYTTKSVRLARAPIVPWLASASAAIIAFFAVDRPPGIDIGLFSINPPLPLVVGLVAGCFVGHRVHASRPKPT